MRRASVLFMIVLCLFMTGCGGGGCKEKYAVSGRITKYGNPEQGLEGVTIVFSGGYGTATTDSNGRWTKSGLQGVVAATPTKSGYIFDPECRRASGRSESMDFDYAIELTPELTEQFETTTQTIDGWIRSRYDPNQPDEIFHAIAEEAKSLEVVEDATGDESGLHIKYRDGGVVTWVDSWPAYTPIWATASAQDPSTMGFADEQARSSLLTPSSKTAVLVNSLADDPGFSVQNEVFDTIGPTLEKLGFEVTRLYGERVTCEELARLGEYGVAVMLGHGGEISRLGANGYQFQTGEPYDWSTHGAESWRNWSFGRYTCFIVDWGESRDQNRTFWGVTDRFFRQYSFNGSLVINLSCNSFKNKSMADVITGKDGIAYVGWDNVVRISPWTTSMLVSLMAGGYTLEGAVDNLPLPAKVDQWVKGRNKRITSKLVYETRGKGEVALCKGNFGSPPTVTIEYPSGGVVTSNHDITVSGRIWPAPTNKERGDRALISINDVAYSLEVNESDGAFSKVVPLESGFNLIDVFGLVDGVSAVAKVSVMANYTEPALWTGLSWNTSGTDLDLHLVPKGKSLNSKDDCYWYNKTTSWGGVLDVDDRDGFGPEHITAETISRGTYELWIHFYPGHPSPQTIWDVYIRTERTPTVHYVGTIDESEWHKVADISFPGGIVIKSLGPDTDLPEILACPRK